MHRRKFIRSGLIGACAVCSLSASAHTPYRQWAVYRQKHLLIGCHKDENPTYELAKSVVEVLEHLLPDARARVARAPTAQRLASLLGTEQLDVALVSPTIAASMAKGTEQFEPYGKIELSALHSFSRYLLICRTEIPDRHAWLISEALAGMEGIAQGSAISAEPPIPWHAGANRFRSQLPIPDNN